MKALRQLPLALAIVSVAAMVNLVICLGLAFQTAQSHVLLSAQHNTSPMQHFADVAIPFMRAAFMLDVGTLIMMFLLVLQVTLVFVMYPPRQWNRVVDLLTYTGDALADEPSDSEQTGLHLMS